MKHSYLATCDCARCAKERARREGQAQANPQRMWDALAKSAASMRRKPRGTRKPAWGTAEWAETRGDDLPESPDY